MVLSFSTRSPGENGKGHFPLSLDVRVLNGNNIWRANQLCSAAGSVTVYLHLAKFMDEVMGHTVDTPPAPLTFATRSRTEGRSGGKSPSVFDPCDGERGFRGVCK